MNLHLEAALRSTPWAGASSALNGLVSTATTFSPSAARAAIATRGRPLRAASPRGIAVLTIRGPLFQHPSLFQMFVGGTSTTQFGALLADAVDDETISQILIDVDSPGGEVAGVAALAAQIRAARGTKPIVAIANSVASSAAYVLATSADELYVSPGGAVGGLGVVTAHEDTSAALAAAGVRVTLISAGPYKTEGNPFGPLDAAAKKFMLQRCGEIYGAMLQDVAKGRGCSVDTVRRGFGEGRTVGADAAMAAGMVDGQLSFDGVINHMQRSSRVARAAPRSAAMRSNYATLDRLSATRGSSAWIAAQRRLLDGR